MNRTAIGGSITVVSTTDSLFHVYSTFTRLNPTDNLTVIEAGEYYLVIGSPTLKIPINYRTEVYFPSVGFFNPKFTKTPFFVSFFDNMKQATQEAREAEGDVYCVRSEEGLPFYFVFSNNPSKEGRNFLATAIAERRDRETFFYDLRDMRVFGVEVDDYEEDLPTL